MLAVPELDTTLQEALFSQPKPSPSESDEALTQFGNCACALWDVMLSRAIDLTATRRVIVVKVNLLMIYWFWLTVTDSGLCIGDHTRE